MLEKEGMVRRIQGRGTFVSASVADAPNRGDLSELVRRLRQLDGSSRLDQIVIRTAPADEQVARNLQIETTENVVHASYVRVRNEEPIGVADIYIPVSMGVEIKPEDMRGPSPILIESKGVDVLGAHQLIGAALADSRTASKLGVPVGSPVVEVQLLVLDMTSRPVELLRAYYRADKYVHHVFLAAQQGNKLP